MAIKSKNDSGNFQAPEVKSSDPYTELVSSIEKELELARQDATKFQHERDEELKLRIKFKEDADKKMHSLINQVLSNLYRFKNLKIRLRIWKKLSKLKRIWKGGMENSSLTSRSLAL